tara:strand:- start:208 stop:486 length:279 start_codon:yes stop_codon:yes gene_type:complete
MNSKEKIEQLIRYGEALSADMDSLFKDVKSIERRWFRIFCRGSTKLVRKDLHDAIKGRLNEQERILIAFSKGIYLEGRELQEFDFKFKNLVS